MQLLLQRIIQRHGSVGGKALHAYGVLNDEFQELQSLVVGGFRRRGWDNSATAARALVLWLAEWSFRHATRINGFWKDVSGTTGVAEEYLRDYHALTKGFELWQRRPPRDDGARWIIAILREGGFPTHFVTGTFEDVVRRLVRKFGWDQLQERDTVGAQAAIEFLCMEGDKVAWLRSAEAAEYLLGFFSHLARYRNHLAARSLLPKDGEAVSDWSARLPAEERPERHLSLRGQSDTPLLRLFAEVSRIAAEVPPPILETVWPPELSAPVVRLRLPRGRMAMSWVSEHVTSPAAVSRVAFGPASAPAKWVSLDRQGDDFVLPCGHTSHDWPLEDATCGQFVVARTQLAGPIVSRTQLTGPGRSLLVFDPTGRLVVGTTLQAGLTYRPFALDRILRSAEDAAAVAGPITLVGTQGGPTQQLIVDGRTFTFEFVAAPLEVFLEGRCVGKGAGAPWCGFPRVHLPNDVVSAPRLGIAGIRGIELSRRLQRYDLNEWISAPFLGRISLAADGREAHLFLRVAPAETEIAFAAPNADGTRTVTVQAPGLSHVTLSARHGEFLDRQSGTGIVTLVLPASALESGAAGVPYQLDLEFGTTTIPIPILDQRRGFCIRASAGAIRLVDRGVPATTHIDVARACVLIGHTIRPRVPLDIAVRPVPRGTGFNPTRHLARVVSDDSGDVEVPLDELLADLEPSASHEISIRPVGEASSFLFRVTDSIFAAEPRGNGPYGPVRQGSTVDAPMSFKSLAVCSPWDAVDSSPMPANEAGQWAIPELPATPGGRLGAPFEGARRIGWVRFLPEDPNADQLRDPLVAALSKPYGVLPSMVRKDLARGTGARERLLRGLENLATMDAGMELDLVRVSRIDGTLCALLALESGTEGHPLLDAEDLRAVPLGAWWTAMRALGLVDDVEKRVQRIHALTEQRPELWAVLFVLGRLRNSNRSIQVQLDQLELNLPPERPVLSLADSDELVPHVLRPSDLKKETWAQLLRGWLAPGLAEPHYDPDLFAQGVGPEPLEGWFKTLPAEQVRRLRAPFRLAVAAARTSLDPEMAHESRLRVRRFFLERSVRRHWREMRPIIDGLHLAALRFYWRRLNLARDSDAELFTHQLEEHLVISDAAISQMYAKDRGTNGTT